MQSLNKLFKDLISLFLSSGISLIIFAILIIIFPNILNYLAAVFLLFLGINSLYFAFKLRSYHHKIKEFFASLPKFKNTQN